MYYLTDEEKKRLEDGDIMQNVLTSVLVASVFLNACFIRRMQIKESRVRSKEDAVRIFEVQAKTLKAQTACFEKFLLADCFNRDSEPSLTPVCGNGRREVREQCDDGNHESGDGCDENCKKTACGNGILTADEQCDDGNTLSDDGCSSQCMLEKEVEVNCKAEADTIPCELGAYGCQPASFSGKQPFTFCVNDTDGPGGVPAMILSCQCADKKGKGIWLLPTTRCSLVQSCQQ